ncbi:hypothetical protein [Chryseobacterium sp. KCF3-3]|uniref:hypothetical protein n=1 Tax=Chryseobacterium sp. KCF3-3 TaxID=3231511 RepID=UPI0038B35D81
MKNILFFLLLSVFAFGQDFAKDTLMGEGTQPATILRMGNNKVFIIQNKELQTPYTKQKDGSFTSNGVPYVNISLDKKKFDGDMYEFMNELFDKSDVENQFSKEIIDVDDKKAFVRTANNEKKKNLYMSVNYPLKDRFLNISFGINYTDDDDKTKKYYAIKNIIQNGFRTLENYYSYRKE